MDTRLSTSLPAPILVTGGTGTLGRRVVPRLRHAGYPVRVLSRRAPAVDALGPPDEGIEYATGDLATDEGIDAAVQGTGVILHLAGKRQGRRGQGTQPGQGRATRPGRTTSSSSRSWAPTGCR